MAAPFEQLKRSPIKIRESGCLPKNQLSLKEKNISAHQDIPSSPKKHRPGYRSEHPGAAASHSCPVPKDPARSACWQSWPPWSCSMASGVAVAHGLIWSDPGLGFGTNILTMSGISITINATLFLSGSVHGEPCIQQPSCQISAGPALTGAAGKDMVMGVGTKRVLYS